MAVDTYTVYIIHPVIIVICAIAIMGLAIPTLSKFVVVLALTISLAYTIAHGIRAIPGIKRVL